MWKGDRDARKGGGGQGVRSENAPWGVLHRKPLIGAGRERQIWAKAQSQVQPAPDTLKSLCNHALRTPRQERKHCCYFLTNLQG